MANDPKGDEDRVEPSAEVGQVSDDAETTPAEPEDAEKVKNDEAMDDRFQATDN